MCVSISTSFLKRNVAIYWGVCVLLLLMLVERAQHTEALMLKPTWGNLSQSADGSILHSSHNRELVVNSSQKLKRFTHFLLGSPEIIIKENDEKVTGVVINIPLPKLYKGHIKNWLRDPRYLSGKPYKHNTCCSLFWRDKYVSDGRCLVNTAVHYGIPNEADILLYSPGDVSDLESPRGVNVSLQVNVYFGEMTDYVSATINMILPSEPYPLSLFLGISEESSKFLAQLEDGIVNELHAKLKKEVEMEDRVSNSEMKVKRD